MSAGDIINIFAICEDIDLFIICNDNSVPQLCKSEVQSYNLRNFIWNVYNVLTGKSTTYNDRCVVLQVPESTFYIERLTTDPD